MTRIYLAGPMSGIENLNFPLFNAEAARLRALGYDVVNPAEINVGADELVARAEMSLSELDAHWRACMRRDIPAMLTCAGLALLPGWENSKGARLEVHIAEQFDMPVCMAHLYVQRVPRLADIAFAFPTFDADALADFHGWAPTTRPRTLTAADLAELQGLPKETAIIHTSAPCMGAFGPVPKIAGGAK